MPKFNAHVLVLSASRYSLTDKETGELISGCKFTYIQDFKSTIKQNSNGVDVITSKLPYEGYGQFKELPGWYDIGFEISATSKGVATLTPVSFAFVAPYEIKK